MKACPNCFIIRSPLVLPVCSRALLAVRVASPRRYCVIAQLSTAHSQLLPLCSRWSCCCCAVAHQQHRQQVFIAPPTAAQLRCFCYAAVLSLTANLLPRSRCSLCSCRPLALVKVMFTAGMNVCRCVMIYTRFRAFFCRLRAFIAACSQASWWCNTQEGRLSSVRLIPACRYCLRCE